jgi:serine protease Do
MDQQQHIISTIEHLMPSVVSILLTKHLTHITKTHHPAAYPFFPAHQRQVKAEMEAQQDSYAGGGSGFIVDATGLIATNKHVVIDPTLDYTVVLHDGRHLGARVVSVDPINDVALVKVDSLDLVPVTFGDATSLRVGTQVLAIGNALGVFKNTVSLGIVSGLSRSVSAQADPSAPSHELRGLIQTDAAINPGNSGGPLVTLDGQVVGINSALISGAQNIGLAIPINAVARDLHDITSYGHIRRPYLGLRYVIVGSELAAQLGSSIAGGAYVTGETPHDHGVLPNSPAAAAGLKDGDLISMCDAIPLTEDHTFQDVLEMSQVDQTLELTVWRGGKSRSVFVTLTERTP